jgi:hypothetical protein
VKDQILSLIRWDTLKRFAQSVKYDLIIVSPKQSVSDD